MRTNRYDFNQKHKYKLEGWKITKFIPPTKNKDAPLINHLTDQWETPKHYITIVAVAEITIVAHKLKQQ